MTNTSSSNPTAPGPSPALAGEPQQLVVDGQTVSVLARLEHPAITVFGNLLSDDECTALVEAARPALARSRTIDRQGGEAVAHVSRTSEGMFFTAGQTPLIARIEARIAALLNWPVECGEGLQVLRYTPGTEYQPHYDFFDARDPGTAAQTAYGGQRVGTLIMYLHSPEAGGATRFPQVGFDVAPVRGGAVFFSYPQPTPASRTLHAGAPVIAGEKWIATKWLRQRPYR